MGVFDKMKERLAEKLSEQASKQAKTAAKKGAEAAFTAAKAAGRRLEEALYGEREALPSDDVPKPSDSRSERKRKEELQKQKEADVAERLRAADQRMRERLAAEELAKAGREAERARLEKSIDDDLAAMKRRLDKG